MSEGNHKLFRLKFLRCVVVVCALILACATARAVTLEEVAAVYAKQLDLLQPYRLRYKETITRPQNDGTDKTVTLVVELLVDKLRYRKSVWSETGPEGQLEPVTTESDNGTEWRSISHGGRGIGQIVSPRPASQIHSEMYSSPLALAGLLDNSLFEAQGDRLYSADPTDVRTLALQPEAALLASPEMLDGKQAYVIEYPKSNPHPQFRIWVSADEKLSLLKSEAYLPSRNGDYVLLTRTINRDFTEVCPGLFLPKQSEFQALGFEGQAPPSTQQFELVSIDVAVPVTDQDFLLEFSDGMIVQRIFTWGDKNWSIDNGFYQTLRILVGVCLLIMVGTVGFVVYRSLRKVR
ncbi:MAG: hypothetical protein IT365_02855 [Candidatus Hydrogenedentes bacterium]|nr:hypothetical protein [Candidatus Hydrogenedentota bacterium]